MNNLIYPFQLPVYQSLIEETSFFQIKNDVNNFIQKNNQIFKHVWDCPTLSTMGIPKPQNLNSLILDEIIKLHTEKYFKVWNFWKECSLHIEELWVNIAKKGAYQETHHHESYLFSGVIYINVDINSGDFSLYNPLSAESILMYCSNNFRLEYLIKPTNSMIILFPGWMQHRVSQNKSDIDRISISFNIKANFN